MFTNFENFTYSSEINFPKDECVIKDPNEKYKQLIDQQYNAWCE